MQNSNLNETYLSLGYTTDEIEEFEKLMSLCESGDIELAFKIGFLSEEPNRMFVDNFWNVLGVFNRPISFSKNKNGVHFDRWVYSVLQDRHVSDVSDYFEYIEHYKFALMKPKNATIPMDARVFMYMRGNHVPKIDYELEVSPYLLQYFLEGNDGVFDFLVLPSNTKIHLDLRRNRHIPNNLVKNICNRMGVGSGLSLELLSNRNGLDLSDTMIGHVYCKGINLNNSNDLFMGLRLPIGLTKFTFSLTIDRNEQYSLSDITSLLDRIYDSLLCCEKLMKVSYSVYEIVNSSEEKFGGIDYNDLPRGGFSRTEFVNRAMEFVNKILA